MRQGFISTLCQAALIIFTLTAPALAADEAIDIMNPYKAEQKAVVERTLETNKKYDDRWYEYVEERYHGTIPRSGEKAQAESNKENAEASIKAARKLFKDYRGYKADRDVEVLGLYDSSAKVVVTYIHQSGKTRDTTYMMRKYAEKVEQDMTMLKARNETPVFTNVKYTQEGTAVRITATVTYPIYHYTTPLMLVVKPDLDRKESGEWEIVEERYQQHM